MEKAGTIWDLTWNTDWLTPWDHETEEFTLTGMEEVQMAFRALYRKEKQPLGVKIAGEIAEHLVVARFNELVGAAHRVAEDTCPELVGFPILSTAHEWDILCPSQ
jgi:hypothetical protein